jgi:hypothetical protein
VGGPSLVRVLVHDCLLLPFRRQCPSKYRHGSAAAFIEVSGAPVELMQIDHEARPDL